MCLWMRLSQTVSAISGQTGLRNESEYANHLFLSIVNSGACERICHARAYKRDCPGMSQWMRHTLHAFEPIDCWRKANGAQPNSEGPDSNPPSGRRIDLSRKCRRDPTHQRRNGWPLMTRECEPATRGTPGRHDYVRPNAG